MRITLSYPGCHRRGGVERVMLECANFLASRDHAVQVCAAELDREGLDRRVTCYPVEMPRVPRALRPVAFKRRSSQVIRQLRAGTGTHGAFGVESPSGGVFWVGSVHRAWLEASRQRSARERLRQRCNLFHPVVLALERDYFGHRRYLKLVALTDTVKCDLQRFYGMPDEDIVVLPNGFSATEFNPRRTRELRPQIRQQLGYTDEQQVVLFVANELGRKGFGPLLQALAQLQDSRLRLLVVGRVTPAAYQSQIERLRLTDQIQFTGPSSDVAPYYAAADVFALPTQYEAWGLVIVEALACGIPVLTSRLAGAASAVQEGITGELLDEPRDTGEIATKLKRLLSRRDPTAQEIAASVEAFSWPNVLERYEHLLAQYAS